MKKLWGGRFKAELHETAKQFSYSLAVDHELLSADVKVSMAHALMLGKVGIISESKQGCLARRDRCMREAGSRVGCALRTSQEWF